MPRQYYTVLHKTEWERLKKQGEGPDEHSNEGPVEKNDYLKNLTEQSQKWIQNWPDSEAFHMKKLERKKKQQEKKNIAFLKELSKVSTKDDGGEAIRNAKQTIFYQSCYGQKLIGALVESRVLKEVDAQIEFNKKLKHETEQAKKNIESKETSLINYDKDTERAKIHRTMAMECKSYNQEMIAIKKAMEMKNNEKEKQCAIAGDKLMSEIIHREEIAEEDRKRLVQEEIKQFEDERKEIAKIKARNEKLDDDLIKAQKEIREKINCKIEQVYRKVHLGKSETKRYKEAYTVTEKLLRDKNKKLEDFLDSSIKLWEKRNAKKEITEKEHDKEKRLHRRAIAEENKLRDQEDKFNVYCANKCVCDRQAILPETKHKTLQLKVAFVDERPTTPVKNPPHKLERPRTAVKKPSFLQPRGELVKQLREREKEKFPWTGTKVAHETFAQNAASVLKECEHKHLVQKVIDEYRRLNGLDETTLPIP